MAKELFKQMKFNDKHTNVVPTWMNLRVLFSGEGYDDSMGAVTDGGAMQQAKQHETRQGLTEAWESFRKGGT
jgi:hypothetical protein